MNNTSGQDLLFSVVVACYNQENLVLRTLDSIKNSTYTNIELIVSDDGSSDNTANVVDDWINKNKRRFANAFLIRGEHVGISANHTRACKEASGEFVKYIGGDDILLPTALQSMASFLINHPEAGICWSQIIPFYGEAEVDKTVKPIPSKYLGKKFDSLSVEKQYGILTLWGMISGPGNFFRKTALESIGYFGDEIGTFEDYHLWLKATKKRFQIRFLPEPTVLWRRHRGSISFHAGKQFQADIATVMDSMVMVEIPSFNFIHRALVKNRYDIITRFMGRGELDVKERLEFSLRRLLDPFQWKYLPGMIRINLALLVTSGCHGFVDHDFARS
jgi:glycosyltransferase involved in cell wall biosynthesis